MASAARPSEQPPTRRLAPPSLFVGPPSRNASESALDTRIAPLEREKPKPNQAPLAPTTSHDSISSSAATSPESSIKPPLHLHRDTPTTPSTRDPFPLHRWPSQPSTTATPLTKQAQALAPAPAQPQPQPQTLQFPPSDARPAAAAPPPRKPSATTQTWRALQSTLEEVELSALSGASVFGPDHSRALEDLRTAQIELARAWARGEGDDANGGTSAEDDLDGGDMDDVFGDGAGGGGSGQIGGGRVDGASSVEAVAAAVADSSGGGNGSGAGDGVRTVVGGTDFRSEKSRLERETENDIRLARRRRVANDRYFERVNRGVVDVVARLEGVASKMGGVEMTSQEIWGDEADSSGNESGSNSTPSPPVG